MRVLAGDRTVILADLDKLIGCRLFGRGCDIEMSASADYVPLAEIVIDRVSPDVKKRRLLPPPGRTGILKWKRRAIKPASHFIEERRGSPRHHKLEGEGPPRGPVPPPRTGGKVTLPEGQSRRFNSLWEQLRGLKSFVKQILTSRSRFREQVI